MPSADESLGEQDGKCKRPCLFLAAVAGPDGERSGNIPVLDLHITYFNEHMHTQVWLGTMNAGIVAAV